MSGSADTPTPELPWPLIESPDGTATVLVSGSRKWTEPSTIERLLEAVREQYPVLTLVEGGNPNGADKAAAGWASTARARGVTWVHMPADWDSYPRHERWHAGHDRNQLMIDVLIVARARNSGVVVIAFKEDLDPRLVSTPDSAKGGTEDCIRRAWAHEIPVWHVATDTPVRLRAIEQPSLAL